MRISIIVAVAENGVIGRGGQLPWQLSADLQRFKRLTMGHTIIMGRRTWESIGRALPGRRTVVVTRQPNLKIDVPGVATAGSLDESLQHAEAGNDAEAFIFGGAEMYRETLPRADRLYLTRVLANVHGDTYFPDINWAAWRLVESEHHAAGERNEFAFDFETYERR
jgi:dihydrofolate reductase